jgi:glycosyltransferase involved in cell wall biosynthesis
MEAAASGLPVIATDIRGCRQVVDHGVTGLLVPLHDADALALAVAELAGDGTRRSAMGLRGRQKAESDFDDRQVVQRTLAAYARLPAPSPEWISARAGRGVAREV